MLNIGFNNYVPIDSIKVIYSYGKDYTHLKKLCNNKELQDKVIDCTMGKKRKSVIFLDDYVVFSIMSTKTLNKRMSEYRKAVVKEEV